jgi:hypothetical protein
MAARRPYLLLFHMVGLLMDSAVWPIQAKSRSGMPQTVRRPCSDEEPVDTSRAVCLTVSDISEGAAVHAGAAGFWY